MNLKITKFYCITLMLLTFFGSTPVFASYITELKTKEVDFVNQQLNRPAKIKFWYQGSSKSC